MESLKTPAKKYADQLKKAKDVLSADQIIKKSLTR